MVLHRSIIEKSYLPLQRRPKEVLCVVEGSVEWIDAKAVDEEKIITSEETLDATAPVIYDVSEWIDA